MSTTEHPLHALTDFLPEGTFEEVAAYLTQHKVHLTITRERRSVLGDYRNAHSNRNHRISINGSLNKWSFLITLLHELAHLLTYEQYGHRVSAHGREWKNAFGLLLQKFLQSGIFPADIEYELRSSLHNPAASSCAEEGLMRVLRRYDPVKEGHLLIEDLPMNQLFRTRDGRVFRKGEKRRKRFICEDIQSRKLYLFSPVYEVEVLNSQ